MPLTYWNQVTIHVPILAKVALCIFSICPSEACVERSVSAQGLLHSDLRARLSDSTIEALMSVRMNVRRLYDVPCLPRQTKSQTL